MNDSFILIKSALDLSDRFNNVNTLAGGWDSGKMVYSIMIGSNSRGTLVDIHVQNERFSELVRHLPVLDEYSRVQIKKMDDDSYHVHYVLPSYEDKVGIVTICHSTDKLVDIFGQDVMEHIQILT